MGSRQKKYIWYQLLSRWVITLKIQLSVLVLYKTDITIVSYTCNLFSPWCNWENKNNLAFNNNHSLTQSHIFHTNGVIYMFVSTVVIVIGIFLFYYLTHSHKLIYMNNAHDDTMNVNTLFFPNRCKNNDQINVFSLLYLFFNGNIIESNWLNNWLINSSMCYT